MKKITKAAVLMMAAVMVGASLTACGKSKKGDDIEGTYTASIDVTDELIAQWGIDIDTDETLVLEAELELKNGKYTIVGDTDDFRDQMLDFITAEDVKRQLLVAIGAGDLTDEQLDMMGQAYGYDDFDSYWTGTMSETMDSDSWDLDGSGTYEVDGDKVIFSPDSGKDDFEGEFDGDTIYMEVEALDEEIEFTK